ncbi:MAG: serine/threonine-protein kinase [Myxococcota bacterium]
MPADDETIDSLVRAVAAAPEIDPTTAARASYRLEPGRVIDETFRVREQLGAGGMGVVYLAEHLQLSRLVALKVQTREGDGDATQRVLREARAMAAVVHENVVPIHQVGTVDGRVYIAMEYLDGGTARSWATSEERDVAVIVELYVQAGRGLAAAHAEGLVHRDFKPDNVLFSGDADGTVTRVRVADFGLARVVSTADADAITSIPSDGPQTRTGQVTGTPAYMAPELFEGVPADERSDQYAFCVSLHEALYSVRPFVASTLPELLMAIARGSRVETPERDVPAAVRRVLDRGLHADPSARYPSMVALLRDLEPDARRSRLGLLAAATLNAGIIAALVIENPTPSCDEPLVAPPGWGVAEQQALAVGFERSALEGASESHVAVATRLSEFATTFANVDVEACAAARIRGETTQAELALSTACLEERRAEFDATLEVLSRGGKTVVARARDVVDGLRDPSDCGDVERLAVKAGRLDEAAGHELLAVRTLLAQSEAEQRAGLLDAALGTAKKARQRAEAAAVSLAIAEAALQVGDIESERQEFTAAHDATAEALEHAVVGAAPEVAAHAATQLMLIDGEDRERPALAAEWDRQARAWLVRIGSPRHATYRYQLARAKYLAASGEMARALRIVDEEVEPLVDGPDERVVFDSTRGLMLSKMGRRTEAVAALSGAAEAMERLYGPSHPSVANMLNTLAQARLPDGDVGQAMSELRRARGILVEVLGEDSMRLAQIDNGIANAHYVKRDAERALEVFQTVIARLERGGAGYEGMIARASSNSAMVYARLGKPELAIAAAERAAALHRETNEGAAALGRSLANLATYYLEVGRFSDARDAGAEGYDLLLAAMGKDSFYPTAVDISRSEAELYLGNPEIAKERCDTARAKIDAAGEDARWLLTMVASCQAGGRIGLGEHDDARALLQEQLDREGISFGVRAELIRRLAVAEYGQGHEAEAIQRIAALRDEVVAVEPTSRMVQRLEEWLAAPGVRIPSPRYVPDTIPAVDAP